MYMYIYIYNYICDRVCKNQPCERKLHSYIFANIFSSECDIPFP